MSLDRGVLSFCQPGLDSQAVGDGSFSYCLCYDGSDSDCCNTGDGSLGPGFNGPQDMRLADAGGGGSQFFTGQNTTETFTSDGSGGYSSAANNTGAVLLRSGAGTPADAFKLVSRSGTVTTFFGTYSSITTPGRLQSVVDRYGNTLNYGWTLLGGQPRLNTVTDSYGRISTFSYYGAAQNYRLQQVTDFNGRQVNLQYDSLGHVVAVVGPSITRGANNNANTFPNGTAYVYQYDVGNSNPARQNDLIAIYYPNQTAPFLDATRTVNVAGVYASATPRSTFVYGQNPADTLTYGRVVSHTLGNPAAGVGGTSTFAYATGGLPSNLIDPSDPIVSRTTVTDRNGDVTDYDFNARRLTVRKEVFATRSKNSLQAPSWVTWTQYNSHNQPVLVVMPEGNSIAYAYEDETNTISFGGVPYGRRIGLLLSTTRFPGNTIGIPSRAGSNGQTQLTQLYFYDPIFGSQCASIEERGNPIDGSGTFFTPQNGGTAPTSADKSRYATITYYDYQKDTAATVQADTALQAQLGLTSTQIGQLITFVNQQMNVPTNQGPLPAGFEMGLGDVNGEGTGNGTSVNATHLGNVVKIKHPTARQLIPNTAGAYPLTVLSDTPVAYWRLDEASGTTMFDSSGNGINGTYSNVLLGQSGAIVGDPDTAIKFLGPASSYSTYPLVTLSGDFTLEAWVKFDTGVTPGNQDTPFGREPSSGSDTNFYAAHYRLFVPGDVLVAGTAAVVGSWEHYVITRSGSALTLYRNGVLDATGSYAGTLSYSTLGWGAAGNTGHQYQDETAIYAHALSADRVLAHYRAGAGIDPWVWAEQERIQLFTSNLRGQQTTATDAEGNLTVYVRYPENDPEGAGQYLVPSLSNQQYGFVKEVHVDADPATVMTLVGTDGDLLTFIGNKIPRTNTPGVYQDLVTRYQPSSTAAGCASCAYDPLGNPLSTTDPRGNTTTFERNELGELYRQTSPAPYNYQTETYYDANRNVIQVDTQDVVVKYTSDDPNDPAYATFFPSGSGSTADLPTQPGPGGSVRPGWFSNLYSFDLLDNRIEEDLDATGSTPASLVTAYTYDPNQNLIEVTKPLGNTIEYDYDERNLRIATRIGGPTGSVTIQAYDCNGNLIDMIGPATRGTAAQTLSATIGDAFNGSSAVTFTGDWVVENTYDGFDRLITSTDAVGGTMQNTFDPDGRAIATQSNGAPGGATPTDRTGSGNVPLSSSAAYFDEAGRAYDRQQNIFLNTGLSGSTPTHALLSGRSATHTGGGLAANATANSNTATVTLTTGGTSYVLARTVFDRTGRVTTSATDNTAQSNYMFDGANRRLSITDALGNVTTNIYDANGNVVQATRTELCTISDSMASESFASAMRYDVTNRLVVKANQGPDGNLNSTLDLCCSPPATANLTLFTLYGYDSRSNQTNLIDPKGDTSVWTYDGASRKLTDQRHLRTNGSGNPAGYANGGNVNAIFDTVTTTTSHNANSNLQRIVDDNGGVTLYTYDLLDRQTVMTFHDGSTRTNVYDPANDVTGYTDENGSAFTNTFDVLGRKTAVSITLATGVVGTTAQSYQYDGLSRMTFGRDSVSSADTDAAFTFDSIGRVIEEGQIYAADPRYVTHDAWTSLPATDLTLPSTRQLALVYDALYRKNAVHETSGGASIAAWQFFGQRTATLTLGNGIVTSFMNNAQTRSAVQAGLTTPAWGSISTDHLGYDGSGRLIGKRHFNSGAVIVGFTTAYDPSSNKLFERALQGTEDRSSLYPAYDSMDRLLQYQRGILASGGASVTTPIALPGTNQQQTYNLDGLGNWPSTVITPEGGSPSTQLRTHNKLNEVTQFASTPVLYDHGNNTAPTASRGNGNIANDGTRIYAYDALNRLTTVSRTSDSAVVGQYTYDALGRRIQKVVTNGGVSGSIPNTTTRYLYDRQQIVEELDGSNGTTIQYVWGQYIDELVQMKTYASAGPQPLAAGAYYLLSDLLYRGTALTDSSGNVVEAYDTDAYGNTLLFSGPGTDGLWFTDDDVQAAYSACRYVFTGREYDAETGLYFYRARYYRPQLGRFVGRDPIGYSVCANLYEYAISQPADYCDPFGLQNQNPCGKAYDVVITLKVYQPTQIPAGSNMTPERLRNIADLYKQSFAEGGALLDQLRAKGICVQWDGNVTPLPDEPFEYVGHAYADMKTYAQKLQARLSGAGSDGKADECQVLQVFFYSIDLRDDKAEGYGWGGVDTGADTAMRISFIWSRANVVLGKRAAHEIGHSLGAQHQADTADNRQFLMYAGRLGEYTRNVADQTFTDIKQKWGDKCKKTCECPDLGKKPKQK